MRCQGDKTIRENLRIPSQYIPGKKTAFFLSPSKQVSCRWIAHPVLFQLEKLNFTNLPIHWYFAYMEGIFLLDVCKVPLGADVAII